MAKPLLIETTSCFYLEIVQIYARYAILGV